MVHGEPRRTRSACGEFRPDEILASNYCSRDNCGINIRHHYQICQCPTLRKKGNKKLAQSRSHSCSKQGEAFFTPPRRLISAWRSGGRPGPVPNWHCAGSGSARLHHFADPFQRGGDDYSFFTGDLTLRSASNYRRNGNCQRGKPQRPSFFQRLWADCESYPGVTVRAGEFQW